MKRFRKSIAVVMLAMGLSLGLVVTTPQNAEAFVAAPVALAGPAILGGTATAGVAGAGAAAGGAAIGGIAAATGVGLIIMAGVFIFMMHKNGVFEFPWENGNPFWHDLLQPPAQRNDQGIPFSPHVSFGPVSTVVYSSGQVTINGTWKTTHADNESQTTGVAVKYSVTCRSRTTAKIYATADKVIRGTYSKALGSNPPTGGWSVACGAAPGESGAGDVVSIEAEAPTEAEWALSGVTGTKIYPKGSISWRSSSYDPAASAESGYETTADCVDPNGVKSQVKSFQPLTAGKVEIPSCAAAGKGIATKVVTNFLDAGTKRGRPLVDIHTGDTQFTECDPLLGKVCKTEVYVDGKPCVVGSPACAGWLSLHKNPSSTGRVECRYGGHAVDMSACFILEGAYITGGTPAVQENMDGDPGTWRNPGSVPGWTPHKEDEDLKVPVPDPTITQPGTNPNAEPENPQPSPSPSPSPSVSPSPSPSPSVNPPGVHDPQPPGNPSGDPGPNGENCMSAAISWNPTDWVTVPVKCAIQWAFVPKKSVQTRLDSMSDQFSDKVPMTWFGVGQPIAGGSCPAHWELNYKGQSYPFICGTQADSIVQTFRPILGAMLVIAAVFPLVRSLFYSSIPVMKVNPS